MSLQDKIDSAKLSSWLTDGIPKWKVKWIVWWAKFRARVRMKWYDKVEQSSDKS